MGAERVPDSGRTAAGLVALALDSVLSEVPPGGHHLGTAHTMGRFREVFHRTDFFDHDSFEQWQAKGSHDAAVRANAGRKELLDCWEDPGLDDGIDGELQEYMTRRRTKIDPAEFQWRQSYWERVEADQPPARIQPLPWGAQWSKSRTSRCSTVAGPRRVGF